jgi:hypothetical protein
LFLNRVELLGAYSMIEHLFVMADSEARVDYTPTGRRHVLFLDEYKTRIGRVLTRLREDCSRFRPVAGAYSPYGILYGFTSDLLEHMALKTLQPDGRYRFSLEDVFVDDKDGADKLAWVSGWRKLPHVAPDVQKLFDYPQQFAEDMFNRIERALHTRVRAAEASANAATGRLFILPADDPRERGGGSLDPLPSEMSQIPELPTRYIRSSDTQLVAGQKAEFCDEAQILSDRREARCLLSHETAGGWVAIRKTLLTEVLGEGRDVSIAGLPPIAAGVLKLMCRDLAVLPGNAPSPSDPVSVRP